MDLRIEIAGDVVERQELLNGTEIVTLEGASPNGGWTMIGQLSWNIGLDDRGFEGDITLSRTDGAELFASVASGESIEAAEADGPLQLRVEYEIDGGAAAFEAAAGRMRAEVSLTPAAFEGAWSVVLANQPREAP